MRNRLWLFAYIAVLSVAASFLALTVLRRWPLQGDQIVPMVVFTLFLIFVELLEVKTSTGESWIPSNTILVAVWVALGPSVVLITAATSVAIGEGYLKRKSPVKVLYNVFATATSAGLAGVLYHMLPFAGDTTSPLFLIPSVISHVAYSFLTMSLAVVVLSLSEGQSLSNVWSRVFGWNFLNSLVDAPVGALLVFSYEYAGLWSLLLYSTPMFLIWQTKKLFHELKESHKSTVAALTTALEADEPYTHGHSYRVASYAVSIGQRLGMRHDDLENLEYAGLLHDIGKIAITNDIVCKPARLTKEEFDILAAHPSIGGEIVEQMKFLRDAAGMVRHHHERPDGLGYPDGLKGDEITLGSHILNLCDALDAMTSNRPYRLALTLDQCIDEVKRFRGTQFDPKVVDAFVAMVEEGSFDLIDQADGGAQRIQEILREAIGEISFEEPVSVA